MEVLQQNSPQVINQTYKIWKKNTPYLYNILNVFELPSCSQTVDWFQTTIINNDWQSRSILIGSSALNKNYLTVVNVNLPTDQSKINYTSYQEKSQNNNIGTMGQQNLQIKILINQNSQVMKARVNKIKDNIIACKTGGSNHQVSIYNLSGQSENINSSKANLKGHFSQGFGLDWHPKTQSKLVSGSYDKKVIVWDINKQNQQNSIFTGFHNQGVEDVKWTSSQCIFGSVGQDRFINIWDIRQNGSKPSISKESHNGQIYSLDFNIFTQNLLITGSQDSDINLWDTRNMSKKIHNFTNHGGPVNVVKFLRNHPLRFASGSSDRKIMFWDLSQLNPNQKSSNQIMFIHGGHRTKVTDFSFYKNTYQVASCQQAKILQVWNPNQRVTFTNK